MMKRKLIPFTLFLAALSASTTSIAASQEISKSIYTCNDNQVMEVIYVNTEAGNAYAIISQVNEMIPMRLMKMASGANYEAIDKNYTLPKAKRLNWWKVMINLFSVTVP